MKKHRGLSLLFLISPLTLNGLTGCENTQVVAGIGIVSVKKGILNGEVRTSLTGNVAPGTLIEILASPFEGYEVDAYYLNDVALKSNAFEAKEGENVVHATFKAKESVAEYGSVRVLKEEVRHGIIEARLEDGTLIEEENRRLEVGTKINLSFIPENECYEIKEVKCNDEVLALTQGKASFNVKKGKNFLSGNFGLTHPQKGLIKLGGEVQNATLRIPHLGEYVSVGEVLDLEIVPNAGYTVKALKQNGVPLQGGATPHHYSLTVKEGMNLLEAEVLSVAESIAIKIPENWFYNERYATKRYYVGVGESFALEVEYSPVGAYDDLVWSLGYEGDAQYIDLKQDGSFKVLKEAPGEVVIHVALKSNPSASASLHLLPVHASEYNVAKARDILRKEKAKEPTSVHKTKAVLSKQDTKEGTKSSSTYEFEAFTEGHSVTKVTDSKGMNSFFYRVIHDGAFYAVRRDSNGDHALDDPTKITPQNESEYQNKVRAFGGIEFLGDSFGASYEGALDYIYEHVFGSSSFFEDNDSSRRNEAFLATEVTSTLDGFSLKTNYVYQDFLKDYYKLSLEVNVAYDALYDRVKSISYERVDYALSSASSLVDPMTPFVKEKMEASFTYGERVADTSDLFSISDYFYQDFSPILYTDRHNIAGTTLPFNALGKAELKVDQLYFIDVKDVLPSTALREFNDLEVISSNASVIPHFSPVSSLGRYSFTPINKGEGELTFRVGNIRKTIPFVSSFVPVESVSFDESINSLALTGERIELKANVSPSSGIESDEVTFRILEGSVYGAEIIAVPGTYRTSYYLTSIVPGSFTVIATSKANPNVEARKVFTFKEAPNVLHELANKTYGASWTEFDPYTYNSISYEYVIRFGGMSGDATITFLKSVEDYYGGVTLTRGEYGCKVTQVGGKLALSAFVDKGNSSIPSSELPSLSFSLDATMKVASLKANVNGEERILNPVPDLLPLLQNKAYEGGELGARMRLAFNKMPGGILCRITYKDNGVEHKFEASVVQAVDRIKLVNVEPVNATSDPNVLPSLTYKAHFMDGRIEQLSYSGYYEDVFLRESIY